MIERFGEARTKQSITTIYVVGDRTFEVRNFREGVPDLRDENYFLFSEIIERNRFGRRLHEIIYEECYSICTPHVVVDQAGSTMLRFEREPNLRLNTPGKPDKVRGLMFEELIVQGYYKKLHPPISVPKPKRAPLVALLKEHYRHRFDVELRDWRICFW